VLKSQKVEQFLVGGVFVLARALFLSDGSDERSDESDIDFAEY